jgi:hypothetical protein
VPRDKNTLDTHVNPGDGQIRKVNPPIFLAFIDMRFVNESENSIAFAKVTFMVLTVVFVCYFRVETQEGRKK